MKVFDFAVIFEEEEERLARDIFSGKSKKLLVPYSVKDAEMEEFPFIAMGSKPAVAMIKVSTTCDIGLRDIKSYAVILGLGDYYPMIKREFEADPNPDRMFTIIEVANVTMIPMDFHAVQLAHYLSGDLKEEGDTEHKHSDILGKLMGP